MRRRKCFRWRLCEDVFPPAPQQRGHGMPQASLRQLVHMLLGGLDDRPPLGRCPPWAVRGVTACAASLAATLAGGGHARRPASADAGRGGGKRADSVGGWCRGRRLFPLARGAAGRRPAEARPRACHPTPHRRGRAAWAHCPTPAQGMSAPKCRGSLRSGPPGATGPPSPTPPGQRDGKGDEAQARRQAAQVWYPRPKRGWKTKQTRGRPNTSCHDAKPSARLPGFRRHPGGWGPLGADGACFAALLAVATMYIWMHRLIVG